VCFLAQQVSVGSFGESEAVQLAFLFGREGIYEYAQESTSNYQPGDFFNGAYQLSMGCVSADGGSRLSFEYFDGLDNLRGAELVTWLQWR